MLKDPSLFEISILTSKPMVEHVFSTLIFQISARALNNLVEILKINSLNNYCLSYPSFKPFFNNFSSQASHQKKKKETKCTEFYQHLCSNFRARQRFSKLLVLARYGQDSRSQSIFRITSGPAFSLVTLKSTIPLSLQSSKSQA